MTLSRSGERLRVLINQAIEDGKISPEEYDAIMEMAHQDGHINNQEQALLTELQKMIENKEIIFTKK